MSNILGTKAPVLEAGRTALDLVFRDNALLLKDVLKIIGVGLPVPVPLLGFSFEHPNVLQLLSYDYSDYPYLTKSMIVNSYMKNNTNIRIKSYRAITAMNGVLTNIALNEVTYKLIEKYCDRGGTFALVTMWGYFDNLVLNDLSIIPPENGSNMGGLGFEWDFTRVQFDNSSVAKQFSQDIKNLTGGIVG